MRLDDKEKRIEWAVCAICSILLVALFCVFSWTSYRKETSDTVTRISQVYLQEMTAQMSNHFETNMNGQFAQLKTVTNSLSEEELKSEDTLIAFLDRVQRDNDFSHIALISDRGMAYSPTGKLPAISKVGELHRLVSGTDRLISVNENLWGTDMILLGYSIDPKPFGDEELVAALVGIDTVAISEKLALNKGDMDSYADIITREGDFVVKSDASRTWTRGSNMFSILESQSIFDEGYSLDKFRRSIQRGESGIVSMVIGDGRHEYVYYMPIPDTDWVIVTSMAYATVNSQVSQLSRFMLLAATSIFAVILVILAAFFLLYISGERRHRRQLQKEKERAEQANRAKSDFLSQMSHEIRTPLNGIIGMTEVGRNYVNRPERITNCLDKITVSSRHLLSLINDILDMSKIESGKVELHPERVSLSQMLRSLTTVFYAQARERGIDFQVAVVGDVPETINGDFLRVSQILTNLISNALKFTPAGGAVVTTLSVAQPRDERVWLRFEVRDTGRGIAPENLQRVFEVFTQENSGIARQYGGSGLGLPITKRFTEMMGGTISVESQVGEGSAFTVELPFEPVTMASLKPLAQGKRALVLDNQDIARERLSALLTAQGVEVRTAEWENQALSLLHQAVSAGAPFEFLFVNWNYCEDMGALAQRLREAGPMLRFAITGYDQDECSEVADKMGSGKVLLRPVFPSDLAAMLEALSAPEAEVQPQEKTPPGALNGKNVLVVEDNEINREIVLELLRLAGAKPDVAVNGREAVERFAASAPGQYDLVLMDVQMPVMDGYSATRAIRAMTRPDAQSVIIIAMTANSFREDIRACLESGMNAHVAKPFTLEDIRRAYESQAGGVSPLT